MASPSSLPPSPRDHSDSAPAGILWEPPTTMTSKAGRLSIGLHVSHLSSKFSAPISSSVADHVLQPVFPPYPHLQWSTGVLSDLTSPLHLESLRKHGCSGLSRSHPHRLIYLKACLVSREWHYLKRLRD